MTTPFSNVSNGVKTLAALVGLLAVILGVGGQWSTFASAEDIAIVVAKDAEQDAILAVIANEKVHTDEKFKQIDDRFDALDRKIDDNSRQAAEDAELKNEKLNRILRHLEK